MIITKLQRLFHKIKNREFKKIVRSIAHRIPSSLKQRLPLPQTYSFLIIGTHGVGLHSLLYFISLCKSVPPPPDNKPKNVLPMPMHLLHPEYCNQQITFEVYWHLFKGNGYGKWGFTQDGYGANKTSYIKTHLNKKVPAVCLVRDPISALISHINYCVLRDMFHNEFDVHKNYIKNFLDDESFLNSTVCFEKNISQMADATSEVLYIDTKELMGESTINTMHKIAKFFDIVPPSDQEKLLIKVNDSFSRCFPYCFKVSNQKIMISSFEGIFDPKDPEVIYNKKDTRFYLNKAYISKQFPQRRLYISTEKPIRKTPEIIDEINKETEKYLQKVQNIQDYYNQYKLTENNVFEYLKSHPKTLTHLKKILKDQTDIIRKNAPHIFENWIYYQDFLKL
ncbi:hypothetical protein BKH41_04245 [Helicobacter sp. 12S02232-10]|uniref:DUF2972 domain-containing protein n=1 Tax=Helicobacter sp. 12S02232-10 TaxID=1476197 RepID=UPI000BA603A5|nr:DUF2972 domain-containing protein [Helicobacter sp. 12S02232-10]PAF48845.1 hypothetical protein BKH41_04245 [Helicobacter sp. 12S02232-10]